jgi:hypothetical protein
MTLAAATVTASVATRLTGLASTGARVFNGRSTPLTESELPCWRISKGAEAIQRDGINYPALELHELEIQAEGVLADLTTLEADMDALAAEGLTGLFGTQPPHQLRCEGITREPGKLGERAVGVVTLRLIATFYTRQNAPETLL